MKTQPKFLIECEVFEGHWFTYWANGYPLGHDTLQSAEFYLAKHQAKEPDANFRIHEVRHDS